jgi:uncharacterized circularly permuted ATP-grasp superfamily protein
MSSHLRLVSASEPAAPTTVSHGPSFAGYELDAAYDEMFQAADRSRPHYHALLQELAWVSLDELRRRQTDADRAFLAQGITFTVYGDEQGTERIFPFDLLPRLSPRASGKRSNVVLPSG